MRYLSKSTILALAICAGFSNDKLHAQMDWIGPMANGAVAGQVAESAMDNMGIPKGDSFSGLFQRSFKSNSSNRLNNQNSINPTQYNNKQARPISFKFTPNMQVRKQFFNSLLADFDRIKPGVSKEFRPLFFGNGQGDIIQQIDTILNNEYGMRANNLADAYTAYWIAASDAVNGKLGAQTSRSKAQAVRNQVESTFSSLSNTAFVSPAEIQKYSELLLIQTYLIASFEEQVKAGTLPLSEMQAGIHKGAKALGVDLDTFVLTETGFQLKNKKRSDATEALPGAEDGTQLASASAAKGDTGDGTGSGLLPGVLIAGLAGSTLAAAFLYGKNKGAKKGNG
jgi:hypothetical protein